MNRKVYSYQRFSAAKQADGASIARQSEYARKWAEKHNLALDEALTMRDEGLSAFSQKHLKNGALGIFMEAINAGKIPVGSVLIVEGLDRLSRAEPLFAQAQLAQIINAGVTVVTAGDDREYSRETLKANPMDLVYSLLVMIRAHEESATKSKRVKDAAIRAAKAWQAGQRVPVPGGRVPQWVRKNGDQYELIPDMAESVRESVRLYIAGYGAVRILEELRKKGLPPICQNRANNVDALFRRQAYLLLGTREISLGDEPFILKNYFPAVISEDEYACLATETEKRKQRPHLGAGKSSSPNLFSGMGLCRCGKCGGLLVSNNRILKDADGKEYTYRRVRCPTCERNLKTEYGRSTGSCAVDGLERAVMDYCSDQMNLDALLGDSDKNAELHSRRAIIAGRVVDLERQQKKIMDAAFASESALPAVLIAKLHEVETAIKQAKSDLEMADAAIKAAEITPDTGKAERWRELRVAFEQSDYEARRKARQLFDATFSAIQIFFKGALPTTPAGCVDILLIAKSGNRRLLTVHRKSGKFIGGKNFDYPGA
jgi:DNA invertase Pin-like site-specific DNA recombinase